MISIDITCDLHDRDESGFIWTYLDEAREPSLIEPGAIVIAGEPDVRAVAAVVAVTDSPTGCLVHLRLSRAPSTTTSSLPSGRPLPKGD